MKKKHQARKQQFYLVIPRPNGKLFQGKSLLKSVSKNYFRIKMINVAITLDGHT